MTKTAPGRRQAPKTTSTPRGGSSPATKKEVTKLEPALEFLRLVWALDHNMHVASKRMVNKHGITGPQRLVVRLIGQYPEVSGGELARVLHVHKSTITGIVQRLEAHGLVRRATDSADARRIRLTLTAAGRRVAGPVGGTVEAAVRRVLASMEPKQIAATREVLDRLAQELATLK
jgi:MarR family transcriptional regulator, organic hydroperoxide resistance regulator